MAEVFAALTPFFTLPNLASVSAIPSRTHVRGLHGREVYAGNPEHPSLEAIYASATAVPWRDVVANASFASTTEVDLALRTLIGALDQRTRREDLAARLRDFCEQNLILWPSEGEISPLVFAPLARLFALDGNPTIAIRDEHGAEPVVHAPVPAPDDEGALFATFRRYHVPQLASADRSLRVTVGWDDFFFYVSGPAGTVRRCLDAGLEGHAVPSPT